MKNARTTTVGEILNGMEENERKEIINLIENSMRIVDCDLEWKEFKVFNSSASLMKLMLMTGNVEYLVAVADEMMSKDIKEAQIAVSRGYSTSLMTIKRNGFEMVVVITISEKRFKTFKKTK